MLDAADATPADLARARNLLVIASTWGEGEPPQRATGLLGALLADDAPRMEGVSYAVLALGDRAYAQFCETGRVLDDRLAALGARRAAPRLDCDVDYDAPAATWLAATLKELRGEQDAPAASVIHVDFGQGAAPAAVEHDKSNPFQAEITDLVNLNSSRSAKQTIHVELSPARLRPGLRTRRRHRHGAAKRPRHRGRRAVRRRAAGDAALHKALTTATTSPR